MSVPDRRSYETALRRARTEAEQALAAAAEVRLRLELLARANTALASSVDVELAVGRLARALTAQFADWCLIYVGDPDEPGGLTWSAAHAR